VGAVAHVREDDLSVRVDRRTGAGVEREAIFTCAGRDEAGAVRAVDEPTECLQTLLALDVEREARSRLRDLLELPIELVPIEEVAEGALRLALARNLSVNDAYYVDLAHTRRAVLSTADRALAAAYERSELVA